MLAVEGSSDNIRWSSFSAEKLIKLIGRILKPSSLAKPSKKWFLSRNLKLLSHKRIKNLSRLIGTTFHNGES